MTMRPDMWDFERDVSPEGKLKLENQGKATAIRISEISMASRRIADDHPDLARWYCLGVDPRCESIVEKSLLAEDIDVLVPRRKAKKVIKRGRSVVVPPRPVLSGYVLVRFVRNPSNHAAVRGLMGVDHVTDFVGGALNPFIVKNEIVMRFRDMAESGAFDEGEEDPTKFIPGTKVKVIEGPFVGYVGVVAKPEGKSDQHADDASVIAIEIVIFGRATLTKMPIAMLKIL